MNQEQAKIRIDKLRREINHHRYLYHVLDRQEISDAALDSLKNELFKLEQQFPDLISLDSPTQRVSGRPLDKFSKVRHSSPMMSLFDAFSERDMTDWQTRLKKLAPEAKLDYFCELKLDGLAVALTYNQGIFSLGATRGDGQVGEDVTQNLKTVEAIPLGLRLPAERELIKIGLNKSARENLAVALRRGRLEVRGEVIMTKPVFERLNQQYRRENKALLANPRNAAAGSIRQLDPRLAAERKLDCYIYALLTEIGLDRHEQELALAQALGFKVLGQNRFGRDLKEVFVFHHYWEKQKEKLPFYCDGVVAKVNRLALWPRLGTVGKGPRYMMAYKFSAQQATTRVRQVIWQVGRTGVLTPTAILEPVAIGGVTVSRATLHNPDEIKRLGLKINDTVIIERAGDVIPKISQVLVKLRAGREQAVRIPQRCPICGSQVAKAAGEVAYRCLNKNCYAVNLRRLIHWASRGAMDIEGLGPKIIEQLVKQGLVRDASDLYKLTTGDLKPLDRFADKSAANLVKAIAEKKAIDLARFIYGLGIRHVGEEMAAELAKQISHGLRSEWLRISDLVKAIERLNQEDLADIPDVGPIVAKSIYDWFRQVKNLKLLKKLEDNGVRIRRQTAEGKSRILAGKIFVLTGGLDNLTRQEAKAKIRGLGGNVSTSVSKETNFVVAGRDPGSKYDKAKTLGVKIINEEEFLMMIGYK